MDDYNKQYYQDHKEELKQKRRERYYKNNERDKYKKTRTKIVLLRNNINKISYVYISNEFLPNLHA